MADIDLAGRTVPLILFSCKTGVRMTLITEDDLVLWNYRGNLNIQVLIAAEIDPVSDDSTDQALMNVQFGIVDEPDSFYSY